MSITKHKQIYTKVNAPVDEGVCGIISALSAFSGLETVESCQGNGKIGAWVCFRYGEYWERPWQDLADFIFEKLAPGLVAAVGDDASIKIQVTASGQVFGELSVRPGANERVQSALVTIHRDSIANHGHSSVYCDDTSGT